MLTSRGYGHCQGRVSAQTPCLASVADLAAANTKRPPITGNRTDTTSFVCLLVQPVPPASELVSGIASWPCPSLSCGFPGFPVGPTPHHSPSPPWFSRPQPVPGAYPGMPCARRACSLPIPIPWAPPGSAAAFTLSGHHELRHQTNSPVTLLLVPHLLPLTAPLGSFLFLCDTLTFSHLSPPCTLSPVFIPPPNLGLLSPLLSPRPTGGTCILHHKWLSPLSLS